MKTSQSHKPVMISFQRSVGELRLMGLVAWGGHCYDIHGLRGRDLAVRLGAPRLWLETLLETVARTGSRQLVLVDPDFSVFMGDAVANAARLEAWASRQGVALTRLLTKPVRQPMSQAQAA
jgi:hypothetical protein